MEEQLHYSSERKIIDPPYVMDRTDLHFLNYDKKLPNPDLEILITETPAVEVLTYFGAKASELTCAIFPPPAGVVILRRFFFRYRPEVDDRRFKKPVFVDVVDAERLARWYIKEKVTGRIFEGFTKLKDEDMNEIKKLNLARHKIHFDIFR